MNNAISNFFDKYKNETGTGITVPAPEYKKPVVKVEPTIKAEVASPRVDLPKVEKVVEVEKVEKQGWLKSLFGWLF